MDEIKGHFNVIFVGRNEHVPVNIKETVIDSTGKLLYLIGTDGTIYNWSNIIIMRKARSWVESD